MKIKDISIGDIIPYDNNPRENDFAVVAVANSIKEFGFKVPVVIDKDNTIIAGHTRIKAALSLGLDKVPCIVADDLTPDQVRAFRLADNKVAELAGWDFSKLEEELRSIGDINMELFGFDMEKFDDEFKEEQGKELRKTLKDRFLIAPTSVISARTGEWQERKRQWVSLGIKSEGSREDMKTGGGMVGNFPRYYEAKEKQEKLLGREMSNGEFEEKYLPSYIDRYRGDSMIKNTADGGALSTFDPVLCELMYRWFNVEGGKILDPFAGGSVRGIVASILGMDYTGVDLREDQIKANIEQGKEICDIQLNWICGDSMNIKKLANGSYDFIFSCPPYLDLEIYSDDPRDLSNNSYEDFVKMYRHIISESASMLKDDRFACFVVGSVRDKKTGVYKSFIRETISAFEDAGVWFYNDIVLATALGSLPVRIGRTFSATRKVGRAHQNVLVFYKGDASKIRENYKEQETVDLE